MCLWEFLRVTIGTCVFCADGIMITNNSNNYYVFLNVFMFRIMSITLRNINPQKEIFHHYDFPVYTTSKYRDPKLDTYLRITRLLTIKSRYHILLSQTEQYFILKINWNHITDYIIAFCIYVIPVYAFQNRNIVKIIFLKRTEKGS